MDFLNIRIIKGMFQKIGKIKSSGRCCMMFYFEGYFKNYGENNFFIVRCCFGMKVIILEIDLKQNFCFYLFGQQLEVVSI